MDLIISRNRINDDPAGSHRVSDARHVVFRRAISTSIDPGYIQNVIAAPTVTVNQDVPDEGCSLDEPR